MARPIRHTDTGIGWTNREIADIRRELRQQKSAKKLQAATIGKGGLTVKGTGGLAIQDGGGITLEGGGSVTVSSEGNIAAEYPDGSMAARFGPYTAGTDLGYGFFLNSEDGDEIFGAVRYPSLGLAAFQVANVDFASLRGNSVALYNAGLTASVTVNSDGVTLGVGTSAAAANAVIDPTTGLVTRSTSSRRYKQDIADAGVDVEAVLALQPRKFRRKDEVEKHGDDAPTYVGFIAEEAADLGLDAWVTRDSEGPESFSYATWAVALQAVNQQQAAEIADLRAENADIRARLERLEQADPAQP